MAWLSESELPLVLEIDDQGRPRPRFETNWQAAVARLNAIAGPQKRLLIHFHGGLVPETTALRIAGDVQRFFSADPTVVVLSVVWPTGLMEILSRLMDLRPGSRWSALLVRLLELVGAELSSVHERERIDEAPEAVATRVVEMALAELDEPGREVAAFEAGLAETGPEPLGLGLAVGRLAKVLTEAATAWIESRKTGIPVALEKTCLERLGAEAPSFGQEGREVWAAMKALIDHALQPGGGGALLVAKLATLASDVAVTLVAASAGACFVSSLLRLWPRVAPAVSVPNVVLSAPAVSLPHWEHTLSEVPDLIGRFRVLTMNKEWERTDALLAGWFDGQTTFRLPAELLRFVYPASLLYVVARLLEPDAPTPLVGLAESLKNPHVMERFPNTVRGLAIRPVVFAPTPPEAGLQANACFHGDYDEATVTHCSAPGRHPHTPGANQPSAQWHSVATLLREWQ